MNKTKNKKVISITAGLLLAALLLAGVSRLNGNRTDSAEAEAITPTAAIAQDPSADTSTETEELQEAPLLSKNAYPEINVLMESYFQSTLSGDKAAFESAVSNPDSIDFNQLVRKVEYIVDYENISCYTADGINGIDLIVYVTYDLKLPSIDTAAPSIDEYYIYYDSNNKPKIYLGTLKEETAAYISDLRSSEEVTSLITSVSDRLAAAIESDEGLKDFYSSFQSNDQAAADASPSEGSSVMEDSSVSE